ncbi:MAG: hypothetical protein ACI33J_09660 [Clostridium sp.]
MMCEKCGMNMIRINEDSVQGWSCMKCGWNLITTNIDKIDADTTKYSIYIKATTEINKEKIKLIAKIEGVNYLIAKKMLMKDSICILEGKAQEVKKAIDKLSKSKIQLEVKPKFNY